MAQNKKINPWTWQDAFGFSQAIETSGHTRVLRCSGQTSVDGNGAPTNAGDMGAQISHALSTNGIPHVMKSIGINDEFGQSAYLAEHLYEKHGMTGPKMAEAALALLGK